MSEQHNVCVVVPILTLSIADDLMVIPVPDAFFIAKVAICIRTYTSGTFTVVLKNNAGTTLATIAASAAGATTPAAPTVNLVAAADKIRVGITGLGVGVLDAAVIIWGKQTPI